MRKDGNSHMGKTIQPAIMGETTYFITCVKFDIGGFSAFFIA